MVTSKYFAYGNYQKIHLVGPAMSIKDFYEQLRKYAVAQDPKANIFMVDKKRYQELLDSGIKVI